MERTSPKELFKRAESLLADVNGEMKAVMLNDVTEHSVEMAANVLAGGQVFTDEVTCLMKASKLLSDVLEVLDGRLPFTPTNALMKDIESFIFQGKKINAIKELRERCSGCNLKDAKEAVEDFMKFKRWDPKVAKRVQRGHWWD